MSGGSHNYICYRIEEDLGGQMRDAEMNDLIADIVKVARALEWWQSGDTRENTYRKKVNEFKKKWFGQSASNREWIPVTFRPMDDEERKYYKESLEWDLTDEEAVMFDCEMPEDGQEILVCSKHGHIWLDTCVIDEGVRLDINDDWEGIAAWMPLPNPYREEEK